MEEKNKFNMQDSQYAFPYHFIPHFDQNGVVSLSRKLGWGLEYLCYQKHLHEKIVKIDPASALEVGCGDGYLIGGLPNSIENRVGVDLSEKAISFAKAFYPDCDFRVQDAGEMQETFDLVLAIEVIEHIPDEMLSPFMNALSNRVNEYGKVLISVPTTVIPLNKKHYRHYTLELLQKQLDDASCGLSIDSCEYIYSQPFWFKPFSRFFDNKIFSFEFKPFMRFAWKRVWNKYRFANKSNGHHLVATLIKSNENK